VRAGDRGKRQRKHHPWMPAVSPCAKLRCCLPPCLVQLRDPEQGFKLLWSAPPPLPIPPQSPSHIHTCHHHPHKVSLAFCTLAGAGG
jgi:hypothetical protein